MKASPPTPVIIGSVTLSMAAIAIDASTALPPRLRTSSPTCEARGWLLATIACWLRTTDRPGLTRRVCLLAWANGWVFVISVDVSSAQISIRKLHLLANDLLTDPGLPGSMRQCIHRAETPSHQYCGGND